MNAASDLREALAKGNGDANPARFRGMSITEAFHTEQNANNILDHAQLDYREPITAEYINRIIEGCDQQIAVTQVVRNVFASLRPMAER